MNVYLVEDCGDQPGLVYAVFRCLEDAERFAEQLDTELWQITPRHVWEGQPPVRGYNI